MEGLKKISLLDSIEHMKSNQTNCHYCASEMTVGPATKKFLPDTYVDDLPHFICDMCDERSLSLSVGVAAERLINKHGFRRTVYLEQLLEAEQEDAKYEQD